MNEDVNPLEIFLSQDSRNIMQHQTNQPPQLPKREATPYLGKSSRHISSSEQLAEQLAATIWKLIMVALGHTHGRSFIQLPLRSLRRLAFVQSYTRDYTLTLVLIRTSRLEDCLPSDDATFTSAMNIVAKAFMDQRLNADLQYELSLSGSGEDQMLQVSWKQSK